jgi:hypothetical protein
MFLQVNAKSDPYSEIPLKDLMPLLTPIESAFFTTLDAELEKVESFYVAREKDTQNHTRLLGQQLNELYEHRKLFLVSSAFLNLFVFTILFNAGHPPLDDMALCNKSSCNFQVQC